MRPAAARVWCARKWWREYSAAAGTGQITAAPPHVQVAHGSPKVISNCDECQPVCAALLASHLVLSLNIASGSSAASAQVMTATLLTFPETFGRL